MVRKFKLGFALAVCTLMLLASGPICSMIGVDFGGVVETMEASAAANGQCGDNLYWGYSNGTFTITGFGEMDDYYPPFDHDGRPPWSGYFEEITTLIIDNRVTHIGRGAFLDCESLINITIPDSVTSIGDFAFDNTAWYNNQSNGVVYLDNWALGYKGKISKNTNVTLKNGTVGIADTAFYNYDEESLTSITIPSSVTSIGDDAFSYCDSLTSINVVESNTKYASVNGVLFNEAETTLIKYPAGKTATSYTIPNSVMRIEEDAFYGCESLTNITIPNSVKSIGEFAFYDTAWYNTQPNGVLYLDNWVLGYKVKIPEIANVKLKNGTVGIADNAFHYCGSLTNITIPNSVTSIGDDAFAACGSLTSINVSTYNEYYTSENGVLFNKNKTTLIKYPKGKTATSYVIPNSVTKIGDSAFEMCTTLTSVTISNSVTSIGEHAFSWCESLTRVTIPNSVMSIGEHAFSWCYSLTSITIPNSVKSIGEHAFSWCNKLTSITIPDSVTSIGRGAFYLCGDLKSITISDSVTIIGDWMFGYCSSLTSITIPNSVTSIGDFAFSGCERLTSITIPNSVTSIGNYAFYACDSLQTVYYTGTMTQWNKISIGEYNDDLTSAKINFNCKPIVLSVPQITKYSKNVSALKLYWNKVPNATGYRVYVKIGGTWKYLKDLFGKDITSYYIGNLSANSSYQFSIKAFSKNTNGTYSFSNPCATYTATTAATVTKLNATGVGYQTVKLSWVKTTGATGYVVKQKVNGSWKVIKYLPSTATYYYVQNLKQNTQYELYVTAYVKSGTGKVTYLKGAFNTVTTFTTQVKINSTYANTKSSLKIYWNKVSVASGYRVYCFYNGKCISAQNVTTNSYYKNGLKSLTKYQFVVKAYKINPNKTVTWYENSSVKTTMTDFV